MRGAPPFLTQSTDAAFMTETGAEIEIFLELGRGPISAALSAPAAWAKRRLSLGEPAWTRSGP